MGGTVAKWLSTQTIVRKVVCSSPGSGPDWKNSPCAPSSENWVPVVRSEDAAMIQG